MDFELRFPEGLEHMNRVVSTSGMTNGDGAGDPSITMIVTHELEFDNMMEWVAFHRKERERELREALEREDYESAAKLRDELGRKAR